MNRLSVSTRQQGATSQKTAIFKRRRESLKFHQDGTVIHIIFQALQ
jgi:hypothetical protein